MRRSWLCTLLTLSVLACSGFVGDADRGAEIAVQTASEICRGAARVAELRDLHEASGLAASRRTPNVLWTHNDSAQPLLYAIGSDGRLQGRVRITGATVEDWEAVTVAPCPHGSCIYIADIGDNDGSRSGVTLYRTPEPAPTDQETPAAEALQFVYPDGPHDAESLFAAADGTLFIVTKGEGTPVHIYRVPRDATAAAPARLEHVVRLTSDAAKKTSRITDAATSPNGQWVVLRTGDALHFYKTGDLTAGRAVTPLAFDLRALDEPQGEGVAWMDGTTLYLAGEGPRGGTLARVSCTLP